jgi:hypothetical protein
MKIIKLFAVLLITTPLVQCAEPTAKEFLRYMYGADGVDITNICYPSEDLWMLKGAKNTNALAAIDMEKFESKSTGVLSGMLGTDLYFIETRNGRIDPAFNLEWIYTMHRQLVLRFVYSVLSDNQAMLGRLVTDVTKIQVVGPTAARGDMDQYGSVIELMPVVRSSKAVDDAKSRTVTYRVPLGNEALSLTLRNHANSWKVDTSKTVRVPLEFFFR